MLTLTFAGRICKDAEVRKINNNDYYVIRAAADNGKDKEATFLSVYYRKFGQFDLTQYLKKGAVISACGRPATSIYQDKVDLSLWADTLKIEAFAKSEGQGQRRPQTGNAYEEQGQDDLPF